MRGQGAPKQIPMNLHHAIAPVSCHASAYADPVTDEIGTP